MIVTAKVLKSYFKFQKERLWTGAVAKIETYNRTELTARVLPLLRFINEESEEVDMAPITLPVSSFFSGGFDIIPDYQTDDLVWLAPNTWNPYTALQGQPVIMKGRTHGMENMFVLCGLRRSGTQPASSAPQSGLVIAHEDGNMVMNLTQDGVSIKSSGSVTVINSSDETVLEVDNSNNKVIITGDVEIDGRMTITGDIESDGDVIGDAQAQGISLNHHGHSAPFGPTISKIPQGEG